MPINEIRHDHLGAECGKVICDSCPTSSKSWTVLAEYHLGYGSEAEKATWQMDKLRDFAKDHVKKHPTHDVRVIFGHREHERDPQTGNSLTVYEYRRLK